MEGTVLRHAPSGPAGSLAAEAAHAFGGLIRNGKSTILIMILFSEAEILQFSMSLTNNPCREGAERDSVEKTK